MVTCQELPLIVTVLWDPGTQGNQGMPPEWQIGAPDMWRSTPLGDRGSLAHNREQRWPPRRVIQGTLMAPDEKEKGSEEEKVVPSGFRKAKGGNMEGVSVGKGEGPRRLYKQRDSRRLCPPALFPKEYLRSPCSTDRHFRIGRWVWCFSKGCFCAGAWVGESACEPFKSQACLPQPHRFPSGS